MSSYKNAVDNLYAVKEELLILGLTGRTGAGCSTSAKILQNAFSDLDLEYIEGDDDNSEDRYKFEIIKDYIGNEQHWVPFEVIEGSCVILSYVFEGEKGSISPNEDLREYLTKLQDSQSGISFKIDNDKKLLEDLKGIGYIFEEICTYPLRDLESGIETFSDDQIETYYQLYINKMPDYKERIKEILLRYTCYEIEKIKLQDKQPIKYHLYTYLLQKIGNNIRSSGKPYNDSFDQTQIFSFAKRLDALVNLILRHNKIWEKKNLKKIKTRICIDAIRNVNESNYLKDKYRAYYLLSISVEENERRKRLGNLDIYEQSGIDSIEYNGDYRAEAFFFQQNIAQCFEMADIHIYNKSESTPKKFFLTWQLVRYITLMIHPGLVTPTHLERCMQLAFNAKYNSGCLSRQVGAIVTGKDFSVKSVGWNDVPKGQLPCNLRDIGVYCKGNHEECFSKYEMEEPRFQKAMEDIKDTLNENLLIGRKFPYCFKDVYNGYTHEKNQVFTRSLHAEENAFLQISKFGGQGIQGGFLFCTASPCELCSKKAYQLGISDIYFIDPYPGISEQHILYSGSEVARPKMHLFFGAIGEAYIALYKPLLAYKDELELVSGVSCKQIAREGKIDDISEPDTEDLLYKYVKFTIEFKSSVEIESIREVEIEVMNGTHKSMERYLVWTGSSYDGTELLDGDSGYTIKDYGDKISPYRYQIVFDEPKNPGDTIKYAVRSKVKDETHLMHPYFAHFVKYPTNSLILNIITQKNSSPIENVIFKRYADSDMLIEYKDSYNSIRQEDIDENRTMYTLEIENPNLFYTYSMEWQFINIRP